ncbi:hypothetical protein INT48_007746 [Thamnidium elegans]|uniref:DNA polymerase n=1 Tax=Thamnidium elegans TaxID=101142 RepID=A0A8H7SRP1_9FUNG|nr:hypothetical protein INT48_007746 [Thamnidium elegans]
MDHYMGKPTSFDRTYTPFSVKTLSKVPIIRIFGSTLAGQKVCLHIHQVFPYFFIPYTIPKDYDEQQIQKDIYQFGTSLNEAMNLVKPNAEKDQHIVAIVLTKGVPFYGYHVGYQSFLKIYIVNPYEKQQMMDLLQSEAIMETQFQPYEAHINYELQFLMDHNLYGMDWLHIDEHQPVSPPVFRLPLLQEQKSLFDFSQMTVDSSNPVDHYPIYTALTVPEKQQSNAILRESYCELELDITGMSILNRLDVTERDIHASLRRERFIQQEALSHAEEEAKIKLVKSLESIWKDEESRRRSRNITDPIPPVAQTEVRNPHVLWNAEPSLRKLMDKMMTGHTFDELAQSQEASEFMLDVMTVFQAIEALYPEEYHSWKDQRNEKIASQISEKNSLPSNSSQASPPEVFTSDILQRNITPRCTTPPLSSQPRSSQFNVSATPTRYNKWDLPSKLDTSIVDSLIRDPSFHEERGVDLNEDDQTENLLDENDDNYFSQSNQITDIDIAKWMETEEKFPTTTIQYTDEPYKPRKLDFLEESKRINTILQQTNVSKRDISNDLNQEKDNDIEDVPFEISSIPPDPVRWPQGHRKKRFRIDQLDGPSDKKDKEVPKKNSSAEQWELQRKELRKLRMQKSTKKVPKEEVPSTSTSTNTERTTKTKSELIKEKYRKLENAFPFSPSNSKLATSVVKSKAIKTKVKRTESKNTSSVKLDSLSSKQSTTLVKRITKDSTHKSLKGAATKKSEKSEHEPNFFSHGPLSPTREESSSLDYDNSIRSPQKRTERTKSVSFFSSQSSYNSPQKTTARPKSSPVSHKCKHEVNSKLSQSTEPEKSQSSNTSLDFPSSFPIVQAVNSKEFVYSRLPPILREQDLPKKGVTYREPYFSKPSDLPHYPTVFAGKEFRLPTNSVTLLKEFKSVFHINRTTVYETTIKHWEPSVSPPTYKQVNDWAKENQIHKKSRIGNSITMLDEPTMANTYDFKLSATKPQNKAKRTRDYIDYLSLEIHVNTREKLLPDPEQDSVQIIFWCLQTEDQCIPTNGYQEGYHVGVIAVKSFDITKIGLSSTRATIDYVDSEEQLFTLLIEKIRCFDPDILVGYEVQNSSWGYLVERGAELDQLSRVFISSDIIKKDQWGYRKTSVYKVCGRHILNIWRLMKGEMALTSYTFENVVYHLLHDRVPHYSHETLTNWYQKGPAVLKYRLFKYYLKRVQMNLDILDASQVVTRISESARVFGIDFYSVISRGSQFKVESIMFRIAKPENYVLITPNRKQVASQRSLECLPLIMEPISQFYSSPLVVLDFQSLYPSVMIAYNYCYSTCLGRVRDLSEDPSFGVKSSFELQDGLLDTLKDYINISPNGIMFVKPEIRKSLLAKMLSELLDTRVMIKRVMKEYKGDSGLLRMLDAKQLTLKLLANVTYGYTSASFSGRMPSVEIADSIVSTGREILERSIRLINETEKWGARVVYGDTDSVFVYFPGKTKDEAFILGNEIANTITKQNLAPIKLKFEKVYLPAVLLTKKRYVGFKYENQTDTEPVFEAKGIETVRRDGIAATQKILESCLKILFRTQDMSELKEYLYHQWTKVLSNRVLLQEFIISKEVRMGSYSSRGGPNGAQIAQAQMDVDTRAEPQYGERVPYVVVYRGPKAKLKEKVVRPEAVLADNTLKLDAEYYIRKQIIPPLNRVFNLMGVDIESWYDAMPRSQKAEALALARTDQPQNLKFSRIDQYYASSHFICEQCQLKPSDTVFTLTTRQQQAQKKFQSILQTCQDCCTISSLDAIAVQEGECADVLCVSLDCPIYYKRCKAKEDVKATSNYDALLDLFS